MDDLQANLLRAQMVVEASANLGTKETSRNSGQQIDAWLRRVHRQPGAPWCVAFAWCMLDDACDRRGLHNPLQPVAGGHLLMRMAKDHRAWDDVPVAGSIFGINHGVDDMGNHLSHVGIVVGVEHRKDGTHVHTIEGNTNAAGGREGNCVAEKERPAYTLTLGYLDPAKLFP
jgi:hypothetical protein